jgi:hypothetical protein
VVQELEEEAVEAEEASVAIEVAEEASAVIAGAALEVAEEASAVIAGALEVAEEALATEEAEVDSVVIEEEEDINLNI